MQKTIYKFNRQVLNKIDTIEKAYFLGWIASDGCITHKHIRLELNSVDEKIIQYLFESILGKNIPPIRKWDTKSRFNKRLNVTFKGTSLSLGLISSVEMAADIRNHLQLNEVENKTHNVKFPVLENDILYWVFLRGVFEGDGSVNKNYNRNTIVRMWSMSEKFMYSIKSFLNLHNIKCYIAQGKNSLYCLSLNGYTARIFLSKIYNNAPKKQRLERKYKIAITWINIKKEQDILALQLGSSKKAYAKLHNIKISKTCPVCSIIFYVSPSRLKRIATCSQLCGKVYKSNGYKRIS